MPSKVGSKGQVVIEKPIREALGLEAGFLAVQRLVGDHVEIHFLPPEHDRSLFGILKDSVRETLSSERLRELRQEAWTANGAEMAGKPREDP